MKNLFKKTMLFAAAAMAFVSCENDTTDVNTLPGVDVTVNATVEGTKSHFGDYNATDKTYPTLWDGNEDWYVAINGGHAKANVNDGELTYNDDKTGATVNMEIKNVGDTGPYTLYALSPATAFTSYAANNYYRLKIGNSQTPSATSCDAAAQILIAQSEPQEDATSFNVTFKHATAYAKFSFVNLNLEGATVNNVSVESEVPFAGTFDYKFADKGLVAATASSTITLNTTATENLWLACAPVDLQGKKLTFTINTTNGPLTKEVTMPTGKGEFKPGVVATFNINMEGIEFEKSVKYELVTDASELAVGDEIIIAAKTANYAISTTQKSNNRAATAIVKDGNYIVDPGTDVQIITVESGASAGTFAFKVGTQYLYAPGGGNYMRTTSTKNANASWFVTISNGTTSIVADRSGKNVMQYNYNNGSPLFACYDSASQTAVAIYKLPSNKPVIAAPGVNAPIVGGEGQTATYTLKNIEPDDIEVVSFDGNITEATKSANGTITYNISENTNKSEKVSNIVLSSPSTGATATISVTQAAPEFTVTPTSLTFEATANSTAKFKVTSTYAATIKVSDETKWSVSPATVEAGAENVEITVTALTANDGEEAVTGTVTVTRTGSVSAEVSLSQAAAQQGGGDEPEQPTGGTHFVKVTSAPSDWSGTYLIVYEGGNLALNGSLSKLDGAGNYSSVSISNNEIEATDAMKAIAFTVEKSGTSYTIKSASGLYMGATSNSNSLLSNASTKYTNSIAFKSASEIDIKGSGGAFLRYNASDKRFRYYKSGTYTSQKAIQLYKLN